MKSDNTLRKEHTLYELKEAQEELDRTIKEIEASPGEEFQFQDFYVNVMHLYHHLNTAWNARTSSPDRIHECSEQDFYAWRQFPSDLDMSV